MTTRTRLLTRRNSGHNHALYSVDSFVTDGTTTVSPVTSLTLPAGTLSDLGGGSAGVGQTVSLLGPFTVAFDTPNITTDSAILGTLTAGQLLLGVRVKVIAEFDDGFGDYTDGFDLQVAPASDPTASRTLLAVSGNIGAGSLFENGPLSPAVSDPDRWMIPQAVDYVLLAFMGGVAVAGELEVYAIIATPAA